MLVCFRVMGRAGLVAAPSKRVNRHLQAALKSLCAGK